MLGSYQELQSCVVLSSHVVPLAFLAVVVPLLFPCSLGVGTQLSPETSQEVHCRVDSLEYKHQASCVVGVQGTEEVGLMVCAAQRHEHYWKCLSLCPLMVSQGNQIVKFFLVSLVEPDACLVQGTSLLQQSFVKAFAVTVCDKLHSL